MLIFQGPVPVADKDHWPRIDSFPDFIDANTCGINDGEMVIKHYHHVIHAWLQSINVSANSESKSVLIFYGCLPHLNIDILKEMGGDVMVVLIRMKDTSHETNVEDLVNFGIAKT